MKEVATAQKYVMDRACKAGKIVAEVKQYLAVDHTILESFGQWFPTTGRNTLGLNVSVR